MKKGAISCLFLFLFLFPSFIFCQEDLEIEKKKDHYGVHNGKKWVVTPKYDEILQVSDECFIIRKKDLYGYVYIEPHEKYDFWGNEIFKTRRPFSQKINFPGTGNFSMTDKNGLYALFDSKGNQITPFEFTEVIHKTNYCLLHTKDRKWDIFAKNYSKPYQVGDSIRFLENKTLAFKDRTETGFQSMALINESGSFYTYKYDPAFGIKKIWLSRPGPYYSIADENCNISDVLYDSVGVLPNGHYITKQKNSGYKIFDQNFEPQVPQDLEVLRIMPNGNYMMRSNLNKLGIFTPEMDTILNPQYSSLTFEDEYIKAIDVSKHTYLEEGGPCYLFDQTGKPLLEDYYSIEKLSPGKYLCLKNSEWARNEKTKEKLNSKYSLFDCKNGFFEESVEGQPKLKGGFYRIDKPDHYYYTDANWLKKSKKYPVGYIQRTGTTEGNLFTFFVKAITVIPLALDLITGTNPMGGDTYTYHDKVYGGHFINGYASFTKKNTKGMIHFGIMDTAFKEIIPAIYPEIEAFEEIIFVRKSDKWAMMDKDHQFHSGFVFDHYEKYGQFFFVKEGETLRFLTLRGEETNMPEFKSYYHKKGYLIITIDDTHRYKVTEQGSLLSLD